MIIWFAIFVPIGFVLVLAFGFKKQIVWWELVIPLVASFILIAICKLSTESIQTQDTEYWGGFITKAEYYEPWDEEVPCRHPKYETRTRTYTDSNGNTQTETYQEFVGYEHAYDVDYHSPYWVVIDNNDIEICIDKNKFEHLSKQFNNCRFVDLGRNYHSIDGDKYVSSWDGKDDSIEPVTTVHSYENRVQASESTFNFKKVDPKKYKLYDYPKIQDYYGCPAILGYYGPDRIAAERAFSIINAKLGKPKEVRVWIVVFTNKPIEAGFAQENYWKSGNKNEFICTIGINKAKEVQWAHIFSWSEAESLKIETRDFITAQKKLDLIKLSDWLGPQIQEKFKRKHFSDFNYLTVEPPTWMIVLTFILTFLLNIGVSFWLITNEFESEDDIVGRRVWRRHF